MQFEFVCFMNRQRMLLNFRVSRLFYYIPDVLIPPLLENCLDLHLPLKFGITKLHNYGISFRGSEFLLLLDAELKLDSQRKKMSRILIPVSKYLHLTLKKNSTTCPRHVTYPFVFLLIYYNKINS